MTNREESIQMTTAGLARVRGDLLAAIAADRLRSRRRRRVRLAGLAIAATLAIVGASVAATTGVFSPAPDDVKDTFDELNAEASGAVDASKAVEIGVIDDHVVYAAPTEDGSFCLFFAENPRSGPTGTECAAGSVSPGQIALNVSLGTDGGFVFGRVGTQSAVTVEVEFPDGNTVTTPVLEDRFFLAEPSKSALRSLMTDPFFDPKLGQWIDDAFDQSRVEAISAVAKDAKGMIVARAESAAVPEPGAPAETGPVPVETGTTPPSSP